MSRKTKAQRERLALFQRGASAAQRYTGSPGLYLCPICVTGFPESVLLLKDPPLTLEDVPLKSEGGKPIALTCKGCNNTAGHSIDAAISRRTELNRLYDVLIGATHGEGGRVM